MLSASLAGAAGARGEAAEGTVRFDFETSASSIEPSGGLQGWRVVEGGFDRFVCERAFFHNEPRVKYNKQGRRFLSTLERGNGRPDDRMTGVAESPVFVLAGPEMTFLVGGGRHADTYVALCEAGGGEGDDREVLTARGVNHERMQRITWDRPELVGRKLFLRIADRNRGGWGHVTFDDFTARGRIDEEATRERFAAAERAARLRALREKMRATGLGDVRWAVEDLAATFPGRYRGREFLEKLDECEERTAGLERAAAGGADTLGEREKAVEEFLRLSREALTANPLVSGRPILFVSRSQYRSDHHNTATIFQTGEINTGSFRGGGALKVMNLARGATPEGGVRTRTVLDTKEGLVRDPDVSFDGRRIVFSMRRDIRDDYHIYEVGADGEGLRQLTSAAGVADIDPLYLPDGGIAFSSTREPKYCMCNRHIMANLFRMDGDGANIHQIGKSTLFEGHGSLTSDGRIVYYRWEYVDRNFGDAQGLWTVNPDGTNHAVYWGNNTASPGAVLDPRVIPGTQKVIATLSSCHDRPWGAIGIIDRRLGLDVAPNRGPGPVVRTWPASAIGLVGRGDFDMFARVRPRYEDPFPLNDKYFLCSREAEAGSEKTGVYLIDIFGNETLLHTEGGGCYDPMPLGPRTRPVAVPPRRNFGAGNGRFYVTDCYRGTHMKGVERGAVKSLRVVESPEKRHWTHPPWNGQGQEAPAMNWHNFVNKRILGTVPVEEDGSAHFTVPADRFVFFQLLDADGMMVQSMRSGTMVQSGESTGCVGCHEDRRSAPPPTAGKMPFALGREPTELAGWYGEPRLFSYVAEVQPVFDRHCLGCHDYGGKGARKLVLAGDRDSTFNASYVDLWMKRYVKCVGAGPAATQEARSWGSRRSRLVQTILGGHNDVKLSSEELDRIATWIDLNGPYYPTYASAYPGGLSGRSPLDGRQLRRLGELTGVKLDSLANHGRKLGAQVSFDRPETSPCLARIKDRANPKYAEALAIIRAGGERLRKRPRADMPGFVPCELDRRRDEKYAARLRAERRSREALEAGGKVYDEGLGGE